jgi:multidrug resistance efflux pump
VFDEPSLRHSAPDDVDADEASADAAAPLAHVASLRDLQRARIEAEAQRLLRLESQLANLQLILKTDQARLAIDRLRFAVHGLCGTVASAEEVEMPPGRRLLRVK